MGNKDVITVSLLNINLTSLLCFTIQEAKRPHKDFQCKFVLLGDSSPHRDCFTYEHITQLEVLVAILWVVSLDKQAHVCGTVCEGQWKAGSCSYLCLFHFRHGFFF